MFNKFDPNGNDSITKSQFQELLQSNNLIKGKSDLDNVMKLWNKNKREINFKEFMIIIEKL